jgi:hypothetical protein
MKHHFKMWRLVGFYGNISARPLNHMQTAMGANYSNSKKPTFPFKAFSKAPDFFIGSANFEF